MHTRWKSQAKVATDVSSSYLTDDESKNAHRNMDKVERFFGELPPTALYTKDQIQTPTLEAETPWFLRLDHEGEISYDAQGDMPVVTCGTLAGLVEHLTRHDRLDTSFNSTFLLTYRSFASAQEIFELLVQRFNIPPPSGLDREDMQVWMQRKQRIIRFRATNILKTWFERFWTEPNDEASVELLQRIHTFTRDSAVVNNIPGSAKLLALIEQLRGEETTIKRLVPMPNTTAPTPILPKSKKKLKFLDMDATEIARQLTIIESHLYCKIRYTECLNQAWQKKKLCPDKPEPAANVKALIFHSNKVANWVGTMVLTQTDVLTRVAVIKQFVNVADRCRTLNNYSTMTSIVSGLGTAPVYRLRRTWTQVSARTQALLEQMRRLTASTKNFSEYRETLQRSNPPCIPFFGIYLTDLTFTEDGIPSLTPSGLINFSKRAKIAEVIRAIQQYQNVPYALQPVPEIQEYILGNLQTVGDVYDMYDRSLEVEPRGSGDEIIEGQASYAATGTAMSSVIIASMAMR